MVCPHCKAKESKVIGFRFKALSNLTNILNPEIIILGGYLSRKINIEQYIKTIEKKVNSNGIIKDLDEKCKIMASKIFENAEIIGAANLYKFV